jgi:hypothetical protein
MYMFPCKIFKELTGFNKIWHKKSTNPPISQFPILITNSMADERTYKTEIALGSFNVDPEIATGIDCL